MCQSSTILLLLEVVLHDEIYQVRVCEVLICLI
jgi:hypothetical protein